MVSDWGAVDDPAAAIAAGLDLEMPGNPLTPPLVVLAVQEGRLEESDLDRAARNVLQLADRQTAVTASAAGRPGLRVSSRITSSRGESPPSRSSSSRIGIGSYR